jgi:hypothetical protein
VGGEHSREKRRMRGERADGHAAEARVTVEEQEQVGHEARAPREAGVSGAVEGEVARFE